MKSLDLKENIEKLVKSKKTYQVISKELKDQNPDCCGLPARSVRRFCHGYPIDNLYLIVKEEVLQVKVCVFAFIKYRTNSTYSEN